MNDNYITVSQLNRYIKYKFSQDENLMVVYLKGEISNFKAHTRGHYYFTLKDDASRVNAIMFASFASKMKFMPQDGMKVLIKGSVSVYEATGAYQVYVNEMTEDGIGALYIAFEQLKKKLSEEGLFDEAHKRKIPKIPAKIGVVTAPTGAAIKDILSTIKRRWPYAETILFPSLVQGDEAATSVAKQIKKAQEFDLDVLIVGRGGGSIEDMWCFNEEIVARSIYESHIPIISAVGHEIDFTIADFVADLRAPTPTGAAEMAVPSKSDVQNLLNQIQIRLKKAMSNQLNIERQRLNSYLESYALKNPMAIYQVKEQMFDNLLEHLISTMKRSLDKKRIDYNHLILNYTKSIKYYIEKKEALYDRSISKLEILNPLNTLKRGFSIVKKDDKIVKAKDLSIGDHITITMQDAEIKASVL